jgi:hypothetical protein
VDIPSAEEVKAYQEKIVTNFPDLEEVWCVMDGLKIPIQNQLMKKRRMHTIMGGFMITL